MLVTWLKFIVTKSFSWFFMIRKRRLCHKLNPMCFLWTLTLQRTYENVLKDGLTLLHITACYCQSFLCFYSPSKIYWRLTIEYMGVLNPIIHLPQWRGFYHTRFSFWRPGFKSPWRIFLFFRKKERLEHFWMKYW